MTIERDLEQAAEDLTRISVACEQRDHDGRNAVERIRFHQQAKKHPGEATVPRDEFDPDWPDGKVPIYSGSGDPTGEAGIRLHDRAAADLKELAKRVGRLKIDARWVLDTLDRYTPRPPSAKELREVEATNDDPGCEVCAKHEVAKDVPRWVPTFATGDVKGNLDRTYVLCEWHWRFVSTHGELPDKGQEAAHQRGDRVRVKAS